MDSNIHLINYNSIRQVAIHEAAHFVVASLGYDYGGKVETYATRKKYELPISVRIKQEGACYCGSVSYSATYMEKITSDNLSNFEKSKISVRLLAGFAAETAYGLLDIFNSTDKVIAVFNDCLGNLSSSCDFCKVSAIIDTAIDDNDLLYSTKFDSLGIKLWDSTLEIVKHKPVREAIERIASLLENNKRIFNRQVIQLREEKLGFNELESFLINLPTIDEKILNIIY